MEPGKPQKRVLIDKPDNTAGHAKKVRGQHAKRLAVAANLLRLRLGGIQPGATHVRIGDTAR